jgi:hypothetical protein
MTPQVPPRWWLEKYARNLGWGEPEKKTVPGPQGRKKAVGGESTRQPALSVPEVPEWRPDRRTSRGKTLLVIFVVLLVVLLGFLLLSGRL